MLHAASNQFGILASRNPQHLIASIEQLPHNLATEKSATSGHKYAHNCLFTKLLANIELASLCTIIVWDRRRQAEGQPSLAANLLLNSSPSPDHQPRIKRHSSSRT